MRYHLILKNMSVLNASAYNNYYVMGMPALTSFNGFTDKLKRVIESITNKSIVSTSYSIITHDYKFNNSKEKHVKYMLSKVPRARFLELKEFSSLVCWLSSEENSFSTAAVFDISGGRSTY